MLIAVAELALVIAVGVQLYLLLDLTKIATLMSDGLPIRNVDSAASVSQLKARAIDELLIAPAFRTRKLRTLEFFTESDLIGSETTLIFIRREDFQIWGANRIYGMIGHAWTKTDRALHIFCCGGGDNEWVELLSPFGLLEAPSTSIVLLSDESLSALGSFRIRTTPRVIVIDASGKVLKTGGPSMHSVTSKTEPVPE